MTAWNKSCARCPIDESARVTFAPTRSNDRSRPTVTPIRGLEAAAAAPGTAVALPLWFCEPRVGTMSTASQLTITGTSGYTRAQRSALVVATLRLKLIRRYGSATARDLADCMAACAAAQVPLGDMVDLIDLLFDSERIPAATIGAAYSLAQMLNQHGYDDA